MPDAVGAELKFIPEIIGEHIFIGSLYCVRYS